MQGGVLYCVIIGGVFLAAGVFAAGMVFWMYVADRWKKKDDPGAPGFLELDKRGQTTTTNNPRDTETQSEHREDEKSEK
jgi:hypothetical protein